MKKILSVILLLMTIFCFTGCGESDEEKAARLQRQMTRIANLTDEEKAIYDLKYKEYMEKYDDEDEARSSALYFLDNRIKEITRVANFTDDEKSIYEPKYQEYLAKGENEDEARSRAIYFLDEKIKEKKAEEEKLAAKQKEIDEFNKKYEKLNEENKQFYQKTYNELIASGDDEKEAKEESLERALYRQEKQDKENKKLAKENEEKLAKFKEYLTKFESENSVQYQDLGNGTYNVNITYTGGFIPDIPGKYTGDEVQDFSRICTAIVQLYNSADVKINHFTISEIGRVQDSNGYISEDTVGICEFTNQKFPKNDYQSFHHKCKRLWVIPYGRVH